LAASDSALVESRRWLNDASLSDPRDFFLKIQYLAAFTAVVRKPMVLGLSGGDFLFA
jgi:hypothetical protein